MKSEDICLTRTPPPRPLPPWVRATSGALQLDSPELERKQAEQQWTLSGFVMPRRFSRHLPRIS